MKTPISHLSDFSSQLPSHPPPRRAISHLSTIALAPHGVLIPSLSFPFLIEESSPLRFLHYFVHSQLCIPILHKGSVKYALAVRNLGVKHKVGEAGICTVQLFFCSFCGCRIMYRRKVFMPAIYIRSGMAPELIKFGRKVILNAKITDHEALGVKNKHLQIHRCEQCVH